MSRPDLESPAPRPAPAERRPALSRRALLGGLGLTVAAAGAGGLAWRMLVPGELPDPADPGVTLAAVEAVVARRYPVPEITAGELAARLAADEVVLFDVREPGEFELSHLPGAIRLPPDAGADVFAAHAGSLGGRTVVFYCSVGVRSGRMTQRVAALARQAGASEVFNLRGGLFRWRAEGRSLTEPGGGATVELHPFDDRWGALLARSLPPAG